jgi:hypothetical protein
MAQVRRNRKKRKNQYFEGFDMEDLMEDENQMMPGEADQPRPQTAAWMNDMDPRLVSYLSTNRKVNEGRAKEREFGNLVENIQRASSKFGSIGGVAPQSSYQAPEVKDEALDPRIVAYLGREKKERNPLQDQLLSSKINYTNKLAANVGKEKSDDGTKLSEANWRKAMELRDQSSKAQQVKDWSIIESSYRDMVASHKQPSAAGDVKMIFNFMRINDPSSTVREGEFATAENTKGVPDWLRGIYNKTLSGQRLLPEQRRDFITQAKSKRDITKKGAEQYLAQQEQIGSKYGLDPTIYKYRPDYGEEPILDSNIAPIAPGRTPTPQQSMALGLPGESTAQAAQEPDVAEYAAKHKISYEQAKAVKASREGK